MGRDVSLSVQLGRRSLLAAGASMLVAPRCWAGPSFGDQIAQMEARLGGRIGVGALDTRNGARLLHRGDERFAMCSSFKWTLAAAVHA